MKTLKKLPDQIFCTEAPEVIIRSLRISNEPVLNKPQGAFWTSTQYYDAPYVSAWEEWCRRNDFHCGKNHFLIHPKKDLKVLEPTKVSDLRTIEPDLPLPYPIIDFEYYASQGYDGFHLSEKALYMMEADRCMRPFHAWDCESTAWFNMNWIDSIERIM